MILETIVAATRQELAIHKARLPEGALRELLQDVQAGTMLRGRMLAALRQPGVMIIAEVKRASPSRGTLNAALRAGAQAVTYARAGAAAISILTEPLYFQGSLSDLREARDALAVAGVACPLLRKDFVVDTYQLVEAAVWGADAVLLIVAALDDAALPRMLQEARSLGLTPLVEVHEEQELARVLPLRPPLIGINNRNLRDMTVDRGVTRRLRALIPAETLVVAESGIREPAHMAELAALEVDAALIGEALVTAPDPAARLQELLEAGAMTLVKICGLTNVQDARLAWRSGADLLGFVLVPGSPRYVLPAVLAEITDGLRREGCGARLVGVFADASAEVVRRVAGACALDLVQLHGQEAPELATPLGLPVILARTVHEESPWQDLPNVTGTAHAPIGFPWAYLLDSHDPQRLGGTGKTWRWELLAGTDARAARVIVAGGLNPENVAEAMRQVHPWGVDVSSGVEQSPGHKDADKVKRFIERVREADAR